MSKNGIVTDDNRSRSPLTEEVAEKEPAKMSPDAVESITSAAVAAMCSRVPGFSEQDAAALMADPELMDELSAAYARIQSAKAAADSATAGSVLRGAFEGLPAADIQEMMAEIEKYVDAKDDDEEDQDGSCGGFPSPQKKAQQQLVEYDETGGEDEEEEDQAATHDEFGQLVAALSRTTNNPIAASLLATLPLIVEYCGSLAALSVVRVCRCWRGLLLGDFLQRRVWIALAIREYPVEVSEMGDDAFLTVQRWSDTVFRCTRLRHQKKAGAK